jgi:hypothetical protein
MKRYAKPTTEIPLTPEVKTPLISDISIQRLIDDSLMILYREVRNLSILSAKGKLDANSARDLRDHLKLLFELKDREAESLKGMSDEQIEQILSDRKPNDPSE